MEFLSTATEAKWAKLKSSGAAEDKAVERHNEALQRSLLETLRADNLVVLAGLGTSLCVRNESGSLAPTMAALWDQTRSAVTETIFDDTLMKVRYPLSKDQKDIELLLSQCQLAQALTNDSNVATFIKKAETIIVDRCSFVTEDTDLQTHETFLRRIARRSTRHPRAMLFTTNYDLCFEQSAGRAGFIPIDGFSHTLPQRFDSAFYGLDFVRRDDSLGHHDFLPNVVHLCKLHGSVDWDRRGGEVFRAPSPASPVLIYPRATKFELSYEPPFLEMMGRFLGVLRQPNTSLVVIGFGFNDKHLSQPILAAVRSNVGLRITVVDPIINSSPGVVVQDLKKLAEHGDARISLIAGRFEEFVTAIPDLVAPSEEELHAARLRKVANT